MQDKHNGNGTNERLEPTFGEVPHVQNQSLYQGSQQDKPFSAVNFSALDDDQDNMAKARRAQANYVSPNQQNTDNRFESSVDSNNLTAQRASSRFEQAHSKSSSQGQPSYTQTPITGRSQSQGHNGSFGQSQGHSAGFGQDKEQGAGARASDGLSQGQSTGLEQSSSVEQEQGATKFGNLLGKFGSFGKAKSFFKGQSSQDESEEVKPEQERSQSQDEGAGANKGRAQSVANGSGLGYAQENAQGAIKGDAHGAGMGSAQDGWSDEQKELYSQYLASKERFEHSANVEGNFLYRWRERTQAEKAYRKAQKEARKAGVLPKLSFFQKLFNFLRFGTYLFMKLSVVGIGVCIILFIYFDAMVIDGYEVDDKWVLPAVVYSRPLELYPDQRLSLDQMLYELKLLQYREVDSPRKPGEYAVNKKNGRVVLIKRPFKFPDAEEPRLSIMIEFEGKRVNRILNAETLQELAFLRMDPVLLDRINRINPQEDRIFISLDQVPEQLVTTLVEIEDRSYFEHFGINPVAIVRAFVKNTIAGRVVEGGSTITQQLVKNYFLTNERSYSRKLKEIFMAISMNHRYTKEQILEAYMNEIYLGQNGNAGIYGFGLASYFYFGVPIGELSLDQIALLVGLIKGPSYYDPWRYPENALSRRNTVLAVLRNRGHISPETYETFSQKPLNVIARGKMNYNKTPAFMGLVKTEIGWRFKEEEEKTGKDFLSGNGIRIFTSLDPQAQMSAEKAVTEQIAAIEKGRKLKNLEAAMIVSSWRTGEVSAVVGSSNPKYDGYNRVLDSRRQVGSLIKPFVYLTAFHQGYHLGSIVNDSPVQVKLPNGDIWAPKNDDKKFRGPIRVIRAMASSLNVPTVRVGMGSGLDNVINTLKAAGYKRDIPLYPSIVLGTPEISPYELNSMYVSMVTEGIYRDLTTLRTIEKNGEIVYQRGGNRSFRTLDPKDTYLAIYGMTEATRSGTGRRIGQMFPGVTLASKTGTTNDFRDSWAVGIDSDEISTVWVGYDNNKSTGLYGSTGAMRLYGAYLQERGVNSLELKRPQGIVFANFDKQGNVLANGCEEAGMERFPAREDRIQYIKQCNNFGEAGYDELPYAVPQRENNPPEYKPYNPYEDRSQGQLPMPNVPNDYRQEQEQGSGGIAFPVGGQGHGASNISIGNQGMSNQPAKAGSNAGFANDPYQGGNSYAPKPNIGALQDSRVEDSKAQDIDPVKPDSQARPAQKSSQNVERQADAFEDELLGIF